MTEPTPLPHETKAAEEIYERCWDKFLKSLRPPEKGEFAAIIARCRAEAESPDLDAFRKEIAGITYGMSRADAMKQLDMRIEDLEADHKMTSPEMLAKVGSGELCTPGIGAWMILLQIRGTIA